MEKNLTAAKLGMGVGVLMLFMALTSGLFAEPAAAQKKPSVDVALILAVDVSYSVDSFEYDLQMQGLARAIASGETLKAIRQCRLGRIAIMVIQWSGPRSQSVVVPWTIVSNTASAEQVAGEISIAARRSAGRTSISALIDFGIDMFDRGPFTANRHVMDISADGVNNSGERPRFSRARAGSAGITINGLTILNDVNNLDVYFKNYIAIGTNSFVMVTNDYEAYGAAIKRKLLKEIECLAVS